MCVRVVKLTLIALVSVALLLLVAGALALVQQSDVLAELGACINRGELLEIVCVESSLMLASTLTCIAVALALIFTAFDIVRKHYMG